MKDTGKIVGEALTFEDTIIVPGFSPVEPSQVDLHSHPARGVTINVPVVSSPMDTVTGWRLAARLAQLGAVGVIHRNMSVEEEVAHVRRVKEAPQEPFHPYEIAREGLRISGPVKPTVITDAAGRPAGMLLPLGSGPHTIILEDAEYTARLVQAGVHPSLDSMGRLLVGAAVSPFHAERAVALEKAGADFLVTDVAHLHNANALRALQDMARRVSIPVVAGNIGTREAALDIASKIETVGGFRAGISSGSICSTGVVAGASMPTLQAVLNVRSALEELGLAGKIPIIADGGVRGPGDAAKAVIAGASTVMGGRLFAGAEESLGQKVRVGNRLYKTYRGMASRGAMEERYASDRYSRPSKQLEEGVEGLVPYSGPASKVVAHMYFGLQAALGYSGAGSIREAWENGVLARITPTGRREVNPHDIILSP